MDYFGLVLDSLTLAGLSVMHIFFVSRLTGKPLKARAFFVYLILLCAVQFVCTRVSASGLLSVGVGVLALYAVSRAALGNQRLVSWLAAVLAFYISQLSFGIINSVEAAVFPRFIGCPLLYPLLLAALALFFALCVCCYRIVLKLLPWPDHSQVPYLGLLLLPGMFFFAAELYILHTAYSIFAPSVSLEEVGKQGALLFLQIMGLAALLCTLFAHKKLLQSFQLRAELSLLEQKERSLNQYVEEARSHYEKTKSFRHDIRNHMTVVKELLQGGKTEQAIQYIGNMEEIAEELLFPCSTNNPVVDILVGNKLGIASSMGIGACCSLVLPKSCGLRDIDICIILSNALDNAIHACKSAGSGTESYIHISGRMQGDFLLIEVENSCLGTDGFQKGTGLSNIEAVAEKYQGAVLAEKGDGRFSLSVLLNIS